MVTPVFPNKKFPLDPNLCFVLMPFQKEFDDLYHDHIKPVTLGMGITSLRADEIFSTGAIIADIWESINKAKFIIADVTDRNPNVFYELGLAHALHKPVIILTKKIDDVPFDTKYIRHIVYKFDPRGAKELEQALIATIKNIV